MDETGRHLAFARRYGRAPGGQRVSQGVPWRVGTAVPVVGALTVHGLEAVRSRDGALNQDRFAAYLDQVLGPTLVPGEVVVRDKLLVHQVAGRAWPLGSRPAAPAGCFGRPIRLLSPPSSRPGASSKPPCALRRPAPVKPWNRPSPTPWFGVPPKMCKIGLTSAATMYIGYETALIVHKATLW